LQPPTEATLEGAIETMVERMLFDFWFLNFQEAGNYLPKIRILQKYGLDSRAD